MADFMGGPEDDVYAGGTADDVISGGGGNDTLAGGGGADLVSGGDGRNIIFSHDPIDGFVLGPSSHYSSNDQYDDVDTLVGGFGSDIFVAGYGDNVDGGAWFTQDTLIISLMGATSGVVADFRPLRAYNPAIIGGATITHVSSIHDVEGSNFDDVIAGVDGYAIRGRDGDDRIISSSATIVSGDGGDDFIQVSIDPGDLVDGGTGNDRIEVRDGSDFFLTSETTKVLGGEGDDELHISGRPQADVAGGSGADRLTSALERDPGNLYDYARATLYSADYGMWDMGTEKDVLRALNGRTYFVAGVGDDVSSRGGDGVLSYSFGGATSSIDIATSLFTGPGPHIVAGGIISGITAIGALRGSEFDDKIVADTFRTRIDAGAGNDLIVARAAEVVVKGGAGNDRMVAAANSGQGDFDGGVGFDIVDYGLSSFGVTAQLRAPGMTDSDSAFSLFFSVFGLINVEAIAGSAYDDAFTGNDVGNIITGGRGRDVIQGKGGDDLLIGGAGTDKLDGGLGFDTAGYADATAGVRVSLLLAGVAQDTGGGGFDTLVGIEALLGSAYDDLLIGDAGNNLLAGRGGADELRGWAGDDLYYVEDAGDSVVENVDDGFDTIRTGLSIYVMPDNVERLEGLASGGQRLTGNAGNNIITGGVGVDWINGGGGRDEMAGGRGTDIYFVDRSDDIVQEFADGGTDIVYATVSYSIATTFVENLTLTGAAHSDGIGNSLYNILVGSSGNNILDARGGIDILTGRGGQDQFRFTTPLGPGNVDTITDFNPLQDSIALSRAVFGAAGPAGALNPDAFVVGQQASEADDRIIYDSSTGNLFYDADGTGAGAAMLFAKLPNLPELTSTDFLIL